VASSGYLHSPCHQSGLLMAYHCAPQQMQNQNALGEIVLPAQATSAIPIVAPSADAAAATTNPKSPTLKPAPATKGNNNLYVNPPSTRRSV
jgi:hypothetical protein